MRDRGHHVSGECRVSVVIPCYNGSKFITEAVESVLGQSYGEFEVIVVNDGSSDDSAERVRSMRDGRVRLVEHEKNRGIAAARNTGVRNARGEFVAFLDQDDLWYPAKLERQLAVMDADKTGDIALVFTNREILIGNRRFYKSEDRRFPRPIDRASRKEVLAAFLFQNFVPLISTLIRRPCIEEVGLFDEAIRSGADDFDLCVRLAMRFRLAHIDEVLVTRREHEDNYTDPTLLIVDDLKILDRIVECESSLAPLRRRRHAELLFRCGRWWHGKGDVGQERRAYREALSVSPGHVKSRAALALLLLGGAGDFLIKLWHYVRYGGRS